MYHSNHLHQLHSIALDILKMEMGTNVLDKDNCLDKGSLIYQVAKSLHHADVGKTCMVNRHFTTRFDNFDCGHNYTTT